MSNSSMGNLSSYELAKLVHRDSSNKDQKLNDVMGPFQDEFDCRGLAYVLLDVWNNYIQFDVNSLIIFNRNVK